jgi:hypothetical protein
MTFSHQIPPLTFQFRLLIIADADHSTGDGLCKRLHDAFRRCPQPGGSASFGLHTG